MVTKRIEKLRQEYNGARVLTDFRKPQFAQLTNRHGRVWTINCNGRALVQFDDADAGWHDIEIDYLKVIDEPTPAAAGEEAKKAAEPVSPKPGQEATVELSRLELARLEKKAQDKAEQSKAAMAGSEAAK